MLSITQTEALTLLENREIKTHQQVYTQEEEFFCTMWLSLIHHVREPIKHGKTVILCFLVDFHSGTKPRSASVYTSLCELS